MGQATGGYNKMLIARLSKREYHQRIFDNASAPKRTKYSISNRYLLTLKNDGSSQGLTLNRRKLTRKTYDLAGTLWWSVVNQSPSTSLCLYQPPAIPCLGMVVYLCLYGANDITIEADHRFRAWAVPWWRHQIETFSALLALCAGNSPVPGEFPTQRPVTRRFDIFFDLRLNKRLSKQPWGWWIETPSWLLWRHCNASAMSRRCPPGPWPATTASRTIWDHIWAMCLQVQRRRYENFHSDGDTNSGLSIVKILREQSASQWHRSVRSPPCTRKTFVQA